MHAHAHVCTGAMGSEAHESMMKTLTGSCGRYKAAVSQSVIQSVIHSVSQSVRRSLAAADVTRRR